MQDIKFPQPNNPENSGEVQLDVSFGNNKMAPSGTWSQHGGSQPGGKKWLIILTVVLGVIIIAAVILALTLKKEKTAPVNVNIEEGVVQPEPTALIRYGAMILQTDKSSIAVNRTFRVDILMDTQNSNIVVATANVIYEPEVLELVNIDQENSVLSMAVIQNQELGWVEIVRGTPGDSDYLDYDDGYNGNDGILASLEFKALKGGETSITFDQGKSGMYLDDGRGTEMVVDWGNIVVDIK